MLEFITASFNEENEIEDLIQQVSPYVDRMHVVDDLSTDQTPFILDRLWHTFNTEEMLEERFTWHSMPEHSGLPETVKNEALKMVNNGSWVVLQDCDERFAPGVLEDIQAWVDGPYAVGISYVYFRQIEIIDGVKVREFQKAKLFKKEAVRFSTGIHEDDVFTGNGIYRDDWVVYHRKSSDKQRQREHEYLDTYKKLYEEGKIDDGRLEWLKSLHHFVR